MRYFLIALLFSFPAFAQNQPEAKPAMRSYMGPTSVERAQKSAEPRKRQPNVEIWLPPEFQSSEKKWPLLVFSHGFGDCSVQSTFLTQYLADHGYIVIAPDHADARCQKGGFTSRMQSMRSGDASRPEKPFRNPEMWSDKTESDRRDDMLFAVESMLDDRQYKNYVDTDRMGLIGHSLGGYTVLGMAGAWPSWKDKRFKAVLALSPFSTPYYPARGFSKIDIPLMLQGGTRDTDITPGVKKNAYPLARSPKYFVELDGAGHLAWTQLETSYQSIINQSALAFFDKYVKGVENVEILPEGIKAPKVKTYWKEEGGKASVVTP